MKRKKTVREIRVLAELKSIKKILPYGGLTELHERLKAVGYKGGYEDTHAVMSGRYFNEQVFMEAIKYRNELRELYAKIEAAIGDELINE